MPTSRCVLTLAAVFCGLAAPYPSGAEGPPAKLTSADIATVQIRLNSGGVDLGFSSDLPGDDPRVRALVEVIRDRAEPAHDHKCGNRGSIRFQMRDGRRLALGLLPGHTAGFYELRFYEGDEFVAIYRIDRAAFLAALGDLGVPLDDRAFAD